MLGQKDRSVCRSYRCCGYSSSISRIQPLAEFGTISCSYQKFRRISTNRMYLLFACAYLPEHWLRQLHISRDKYKHIDNVSNSNFTRVCQRGISRETGQVVVMREIEIATQLSRKFFRKYRLIIRQHNRIIRHLQQVIVLAECSTKESLLYIRGVNVIALGYRPSTNWFMQW